ncbi:kinase-like domain-containing protein, partial [Tanacetum coccineum]
AHVGDFGLARLLGADLNQNSSTGVKGTIGYAPLEYGIGSEMTGSGDVYSFGILLLEVMTGKKPTDSMFNENGLSLHKFAYMALPDYLIDVIDNDAIVLQSTEANAKKVEECLIATIKIGVSCSLDSPPQRMKIEIVVTELQRILDNVESAKELWDSLESKYMAEDASSKKFLGNGKEVDRTFVNMTEEGKNKNNKQNKGKKRGFKENNSGSGSNKKPKFECWKCGKTDHFKRDCHSGNKKNANAGGSGKGLMQLRGGLILVLQLMVVVRLPDPKKKTVGEKDFDCIFVGYAEHSKAYRLYVIEPDELFLFNSIIESRDAILMRIDSLILTKGYYTKISVEIVNGMIIL